MGKVVQFPQSVLIQQELRRARRRMEWVDQLIENGPGDTVRSQCAHAAALACYDLDVAALRKAEAATATLDMDDTLHHRGMVYRAYVSIEGAN